MFVQLPVYVLKIHTKDSKQQFSRQQISDNKGQQALGDRDMRCILGLRGLGEGAEPRPGLPRLRPGWELEEVRKACPGGRTQDGGCCIEKGQWCLQGPLSL